MSSKVSNQRRNAALRRRCVKRARHFLAVSSTARRSPTHSRQRVNAARVVRWNVARRNRRARYTPASYSRAALTRCCHRAKARATARSRSRCSVRITTARCFRRRFHTPNAAAMRRRCTAPSDLSAFQWKRRSLATISRHRASASRTVRRRVPCAFRSARSSCARWRFSSDVMKHQRQNDSFILCWLRRSRCTWIRCRSRRDAAAASRHRPK
mmetsp:Transcript_3761/g.9006  ORF Transcript_3761/g.9006 Transcript_3761/m.9006 type:complete len:212 (+) Transcript_3761:106-741(+)